MSGNSKKKSGSKKSGSTKGVTHSEQINSNNGNGNEPNNDLIRPKNNLTINPRGILTGFYQKNGKRIQHIVQDGALQMPKDAVDVIETAKAKLATGMEQSDPEYDLPGLDSVIRPCLDPKLETIIVTELVMEKVQIPQIQPTMNAYNSALGVPGAPIVPPGGQAPVKMIKTSRPKATNRLIRRIPSSDAKKQSGSAVERIRGGGDFPIESQQPQRQDPETVVPMDIDQAATSVVEPSTVGLATQVSGGQNASNSNARNVGLSNDVAVEPKILPPQNQNQFALDTIHQEKLMSVETKVATEVPKVSTPLESSAGNLDIPKATTGEVTRVPNNSTAITSRGPTTNDQTIPSSFMPPKNISNTDNLRKDDLSIKGNGTENISISEVPVSRLSIPPPANTSKSASALITNEPDRNNMDPSRQSITTSETPAVEAARISTMASSSIGKNASTGSSTLVGGKGAVSEIKPASMKQTLPNPQVSDAAVNNGEVDGKPTVSVTPVTALSTDPVDSSSSKPAVVSTLNPLTKVVGSSSSSTVNNTSSAESPCVATGATEAPQTTPVVTSSMPAPDTKPAQPPVKEEEKKVIENVPEAKTLSSVPAAQWDQHKPGPNDETVTPENQLPPKPDWYKKDGINELERTMLPEWFDASSSHRTPEAYMRTREKIIQISKTLSNRNVTNAMIRRSIVGDAGSLQRLRKFLVNWGIINRDGINDSAPTSASLRTNLKRSAKFNDDMLDDLILAVTQEAAKKRKLASSSSTSLSFDWEEIACQVGHGVSAENCRENFMVASLKEETSNTMDVTEDNSPLSGRAKQENRTFDQSGGSSQESVLRNLVESSNPEVLKKMFDVAIEATSFDAVETQAASLLGIHTTQAVESARGHEIDLALRLSKLLDVRMQKLENRMAMLDDVEGILEAEKVALEMERRDLYTARCRHWFGGV